MIRHDVVQGTTDWAMLRVGIPTASQFHRILTPGKLELSKQCGDYANELLAEQHLGVPLDSATSGFMERGTILEKKAFSFYELQRDCTLEKVGFVARDDGRVGCSPDAFIVNEPGGVEIKTPAADTHIGYLLGAAGEKYKLQVQGCLWLCEREYWDFVSYNPEMPSTIVRFDRNDEIITKIDKAVSQFLDYLDESKLKLQQQYGMFPDFTIRGLKIA